MERRIHKRIYINEKATMIIEDKTYDGYIVNMSEHGISFTINTLFSVQDETVRNSVVELTCNTSSDEAVKLKCEVIWLKKGLYTGKTIALGMNIKEPPIEYQNWIKNLLVSNSYIDYDKSNISF